MVSEIGYNKIRHLFPPPTPKKQQKIIVIAIIVNLDGFSVNILLIHYPNSANSETIFGVLSSRQTFQTPNMKAGLKVYLLGSQSIFRILCLARESKKQFLWEK